MTPAATAIIVFFTFMWAVYGLIVLGLVSYAEHSSGLDSLRSRKHDNFASKKSVMCHPDLPE